MIYQNKNTGLNVAHGTITKIEDNKLTLNCEYIAAKNENNKTKYVREHKDLTILAKSTDDLYENNEVTVTGYLHGQDTIAAENILKGVGALDIGNQVVVQGWVSNAKAGTFPAGTKKAGEASYSFNIRVGKNEAGEPVSYSISASNYTEKKVNTRTTDRLAKTMQNLNKEVVEDGKTLTTGVFATLVVSPNAKKPESVSEYNGNTYHYKNAYFNDVMSMSEFKEVKYEKKNAQEVSEPQQGGDGFANEAPAAGNQGRDLDDYFA